MNPESNEPVPGVPEGERRFIVGAMGVAVLITVTYWVLWFAARGVVASNTTASYDAFENAFPAADAWLCICLVAAIWTVRRRRPVAVVWLAAAGSSAIYLFAMDVLYDLEQQVWWRSGAGGWNELGINVLTLALGVLLLSWTLRRRIALQSDD